MIKEEAEEKKEKIYQDLNLDSLSTIQKVLILQRLLKEMAAKKQIFIENKEQMISKIDENCYKYFEKKIKAKKSFDYINNKNENKYILIKNVKESLGELYEPIYNFYFLLQNDNSLMLKLIELCHDVYYEEISDFFVHFLYIDTINFSFVESKLIQMIYLLLENFIIKILPKKIENNEIPINCLKDTFLYYVFKSLTRKIDLRNFLSNILSDIILRFASHRLTLSVIVDDAKKIMNVKNSLIYRNFTLSIDTLKDDEIRTKKKKFKASEAGNNKINSNIGGNFPLKRTKKIVLGSSILIPNDNDDNKEKAQKEESNNILDEYDIIDEKGEITEQKKIEEKPTKEYKKRKTNEEENNKKEKKQKQHLNIEKLKIKEKNITQIGDSVLIKDITKLSAPKKASKVKSEKLKRTEIEAYINNDINESLFICNDITKKILNEKLEKYEKEEENNINLAMKEYLKNLIKKIDESKIIDEIKIKRKNQQLISDENLVKIKVSNNEIFSSAIFIELLPSTDASQMIEKIKINYSIITNNITKIINELSKNILSFPYSIKCIFKIISELLDKKYSTENNNRLSPYQKYMIKIQFLLGNIILPLIKNPSYNGIITNVVISNKTKENLDIIYDIFDKIISGNLFNRSEDYEMTLYNIYIIKILPKIFELMDNIGKNFELPTNLKYLINNENVPRKINYDYFKENPKENIEFQCICFSLEILHIYNYLIGENMEILINQNENIEQKNILKAYYDKESIIRDKYIEELSKYEGKQKQFYYLNKVLYSGKFQNEIKNICKDNFCGSIPKNKENLIISYKKCLMEILNYTNKIQYENFYDLTELKTEKTLKKNKRSKSKNEDKNKKSKNKSKKGLRTSLIKIIETKKDEDVDFKNIIFPQIRKNIIFEMKSNINKRSQRIIFSTNYLHLHMRNLPKKYVENNYGLLFDELIIETKINIEVLWSNILFEYYKKLNEVERLNKITLSFNSKISELENLKYVENLYNELELPCYFKFEKDKNGVFSNISYRTKVESQDELDFTILIDIEPQHIENMIANIPNFREYEKEYDDILYIEKNSQISTAFKDYFKILGKLVDKKEKNKINDEAKLSNIKSQLKNYIFNQLYEKLFPSETSEKDLFIYKKCQRLSFLKPENVIKNKNVINETLLNEASKYFAQIDNKLAPIDKMKCMIKGKEILENSISFSTGSKGLGVDDINSPFIYSMIKAKPKNLNSNIQYCKLYLKLCDSEGAYDYVLTLFDFILEIILNMCVKDLCNVTEEQFGKDEFELDKENENFDN